MAMAMASCAPLSRPTVRLSASAGARRGPVRAALPQANVMGLGCGVRAAVRLPQSSFAKGSAISSAPMATRTAREGSTTCSAAAGAASMPAPDAPAPGGGIVASLRAVAFYLTTVAIAIPLFAIMLVQHPFVMLFDKYRRLAQHVVNDVWANMSTFLYYPIEIVGKENLPARNEPVVYVANHSSYLDIFSLFALWRPFKFISKTSNFLIPIIGWSMFLTGHVGLKRMDRRSQMECLQKCRDLLGKGVAVLFFPEGTRTDDGNMGEFKKGAFAIAVKEKVPVVPITLVGTFGLMPNGGEGKLNKGRVKIVVHPQMEGTNADEMCAGARDVIASALPPGTY